MSMRMKKILFFFKKKLEKIYTLGVNEQVDNSQRNYIILSNIVSINTLLVNLFTSFLFLVFTTNKLAVVMSACSGIFLAVPIYINTKGYHSLAKLYMCTANIFVMISCCVFSANDLLKNYFFSVIISCVFLFSYKELKLQFLAVSISLSCYIIESSSVLRNYLPQYDFESKTEYQTDKLIISIACLLFIIVDVLSYIYLTILQENQIKQNEKILKHAQNKLRIQNEDLQTFSIAATHSLQTPIYVSKFLLNKVTKNYKDVSQKNSNNKSLDIIEDSFNQMDQLLNGLFSYSRIINIENTYSTFDIADECMLIKKRTEEKFTGRKILLPSENITITTSRILFSIIIQNLAENGLKYNTSEKPVVELHFSVINQTVSFFISDNGIGIEEKNLKKIFEPFKRINTGSEFPGNGLGLSGAKRAAERIGGTLFCKESSSAGSVFQLNIPL